MSEWISVEDRLPELHENESDKALVFCGSNETYVAHLIYLPIDGYRKESRCYWSEDSTGCGCCSSELKVTHWMPLPKEPDA